MDTYDHVSDGEGHVCFPMPQGFVERPVPRTAGSRLTQFDRQPIEAVKVFAVLVDATRNQWTVLCPPVCRC